MEKLNITKFLKDCPQGMKLNCVILENLYFDKISEDEHSKYPIFCFTIDENGNRNSISFTKDGCVTTRYGSKCVIFPEGKTTWEGFQRPFKDGDILTNERGSICIYKGPMYYSELLVDFYCGYRISDGAFISKLFKDKHFGAISEYRFATEEEKQKLFDAIKENGYKWNTETKTLEKLIEPKFKVGDRIRHKDDKTVITITGIKDDYYFIQFYNIKRCDYQNEKVSFKDQNKYELVPNKFDITTLVPFESKVLVRDVDHNEWEGAIFGRYDGKAFFTIGGLDWRHCIPYKGNEHLFGTTDDCDDYYKVWKS